MKRACKQLPRCLASSWANNPALCVRSRAVGCPALPWLTLKMVFSSSCWGLCRVACFQGIWKRLASRFSQISPGYIPLSTCATSHGFRRTLRGCRAMVCKGDSRATATGYLSLICFKETEFISRERALSCVPAVILMAPHPESTNSA